MRQHDHRVSGVRRSVAPGGLALAAAMLLAGSARGQTAKGDVDVAALVEEGDRARLAGRFAEAEASYREALVGRADDGVALSLATALAAQGKAEEAAPLLARLARAGSGLSDEGRGRAARALEDARRVLAVVTVQVTVPGAAVDVDGALAGRAPLGEALYLRAGRRVVRAAADGWLPAEVTVEAKAGGAYVVQLELRPFAVPAVVSPALRGAVVGAAPSEAPELDAATLFVGPGGKVRAASLLLSATALAGAVGALVVAQVDDGQVRAQARRIEQTKNGGCADPPDTLARDCSALAQAFAARDAAAMAAAALFVGGGIAGGVALVSMFAMPPPANRPGPRVAVRPFVGPTAGGLSVEASW